MKVWGSTLVVVFWICVLPVILWAGASGTPAQGTIGLMAGSFISGILLTFTPCVLPMVPIVSSIIAGQGEELTKVKAFWLSFAYVLGTAVTYALMGALAGATGEQLQAYFQNVWAIGAISLIFVAMALSMFGLYTIQLPALLQSKLDASTRRLKGGALLPVFLLGMVSAMILGACVSPILISFLSVAIATQDALLGAMTMFALAMGMGVPLIIVGLGAGALIPKAGSWMEEVKHLFGVLLLAVAIYLFTELGIVNTLLVWGIFAVVLGVYLHALEPLEKEHSGWQTLKKSMGVVLLVWGVILMVGGAGEGESLTKPLKHTSTITLNGSVTSQYRFPFELVRNMKDLDAKRKEAVEKDKLLVVYFYSDTCPVCKKMKATTFKDPKVIEKLASDFVAVRVNITDHADHESMKIKKHYKIFGTPAFLFFDRSGEMLESEKFYGYEGPEEFYNTLDLLS